MPNSISSVLPTYKGSAEVKTYHDETDDNKTLNTFQLNEISAQFTFMRLFSVYMAQLTEHRFSIVSVCDNVCCPWQ